MPADPEGSGIVERETIVRRLLRRAAGQTRNSQRRAAEVPFGRENDPNLEFQDSPAVGGLGWLLGALTVFLILHAAWVRLGVS